jgi:CRISPR/Cas system-associated endonuclease Cas1
LVAKLSATADTAGHLPSAGPVADYLRECVTRVPDAGTAEDCREIEGEAAATYFAAWQGLQVSFDTAKGA